MKDDGASCRDIDAFLSFSMAYNHSKAHTILAIILGPHFKNMKCIWDFVSNSIVVEIVGEYDVKIVCVLLL